MMTPEALTGYERQKTLECLELLQRKYPDVVKDALYTAICHEGTRDFRGALGLKWRECQMFSMVGEMKVATFGPLKREVFNQARGLWSSFPLQELEAIYLEQGMPDDDSEAAWDSYRLA